MFKTVIGLLFLCQISFCQTNEINSAKEFQEQMNIEFADSLKSPLLPEDLKDFEALDFYEISEKYIVTATFIKSKKQKPFKMATSTNRTPMYLKYGELHFELEGKKCVLNVYQNIELTQKPGFKDYLFLPFFDETCGKESYIGGRYLDMRVPDTKTVIINFNKAYNPYCAYNYNFSCPKVPLENELSIQIFAGVKKFHD
jgi:hypothetical protein